MPPGIRKNLLIVATTTGYQLNMFRDAALRVGAEASLATDRCHVLDDPWGDRAIPVRFADIQESAATFAPERRFDAVTAIGDRPAYFAALAAKRLNLPFHRPEAVAAATNKFATRECFRKAGLPVPTYFKLRLDEDPMSAAKQAPYPCVLKPLGLSTSRGVIRADDPQGFISAFGRIRKLLKIPSLARLKDPRLDYIQIETFLPGCEFALDGLVTDGRLQVLALFDKPDPLDGPYFQETIYVSPSRQPFSVQQAICNTTQAAVTALGLHQGPVHAEMRFDGKYVWMLEVAPRAIGGLCAKALAFENGASLEEAIVRHALGEDVSNMRPRAGAAGVMMVPVPRAGVYHSVTGVPDAEAIVEEVIITAKEGQRVLPLPEGNTYLGFLFAYGKTALDVEERLRRAHNVLRFEIAEALPVVV
ncbi:MAG TPA: ATP-grasp domain-containing protein [Bryobacteraceae bacterium]|nr:ATP-grasp domain-containing protein [Bryobacteraceae bacterium]